MMTLSTKRTTQVYQLSDEAWVVGVFGEVGIGNGRKTWGYIREIRCADRTCAEDTAKFYTRD